MRLDASRICGKLRCVCCQCLCLQQGELFLQDISQPSPVPYGGVMTVGAEYINTLSRFQGLLVFLRRNKKVCFFSRDGRSQHRLHRLSGCFGVHVGQLEHDSGGHILGVADPDGSLADISCPAVFIRQLIVLIHVPVRLIHPVRLQRPQHRRVFLRAFPHRGLLPGAQPCPQNLLGLYGIFGFFTQPGPRQHHDSRQHPRNPLSAFHPVSRFSFALTMV